MKKNVWVALDALIKSYLKNTVQSVLQNPYMKVHAFKQLVDM